MFRALLCLSALLLLPSQGKTLKIFVLAGESNALGDAGTTSSSLRAVPPGGHAAEGAAGVPFFWKHRSATTTEGSASWGILASQLITTPAGSDAKWGPEIGFARLLWDAGYRDFGIVKASGFDAGNGLWLKGSSDDRLYKHLRTTTQAAIAQLPAGYDDQVIAGLLYAQGESNAAAEAAIADTRFSQLIVDLKADLPTAATLSGVFGEIGGAGTNRDTTRTRQKVLADARADIGYAESTGLTTQSQDGLAMHYDAASLLILGERMAAEMIGTGVLGAGPLPAWAQLHAWFIADHGSGFDSNGAVQRWASMKDGSAARDLTRRVAGQTFRRPVVLEDGSPRDVLRFDGSNDLWANSTEFGSLTSGRSVAVLCRTSATSNGFLFDGATGTGRTRAQISGGVWQAGVATSAAAWNAAEPITVARQADVWQRHVFVYEPFDAGSGNIDTRVRHLIDGVQVANVVDVDASSLIGFILASNGGSPFTHLATDVAEVAVFSKALDATEVGTLDSAWANRWKNPALPPFAASVSQTATTVARFGRHALLNIAIDSPTSGTTTLKGINVTLAPGTRANASVIALYGTVGGVFDPSSTPLALVTDPGSDQIAMTFTAPLPEGRNQFVLAIEPRRYAPLGTSLDARVENITLEGTPSGTFIPSTPDPAGNLVLGLVPYFNDVRRSGQDAVNTYRIPGIASDNLGVMHAVYDIRYANSADLPANVDVGYSRSEDGGATWTPMEKILDFDASVAGSSGNGVGDPSILYDPVTHTLWVAALWSFGNHAYNGSGAGTLPTETGQYILTKSSDGGRTWSAPINITAAVKDDVNWRIVFQGPGHGFAMRNGTLVFPSQYRDAAGTVRVCSVFSSDHGATWDFGSGIPTSSPQTNENTACELDDGRLLFSMRTPSGSNGQRAWARYTPGGTTPMKDGSWGTLFRLPSVPDPICQGSVIQWTSTHRGNPRELILFGNPASSSSRVNFTLRVSADGGDSWPVSRLLYPGPGAYSSICILPDRSIGLLLEKDDYTRITFIRVEEDWLLDPATDTDGDGLPDNWERLNGTQPSIADANADPDRDGQTNLQEYLAGTNPRAVGSIFAVSSHTREADGFHLTWSTVPGKTYSLESTTDLTTWLPVNGQQAVTADGASSSAIVRAEADETRRFFRVRVIR